jgi:hypothetical protein
VIPPEDTETGRVVIPPADPSTAHAIFDASGRVLVPGSELGFGELRPGLRRIANGLVVYGVIGLIVALLGLVALAWAGGRIDDLSDKTAARVSQVADTLDSTSQALTDASDTAKTFGTTLTTTVAAVDAASSRVRELEPTLADLETQFRSINILGAQPLSKAADVVGSIHGTLDGLDTQLSTVADSLRNGHDRLAANASSLGVLGTRLGALADDLRSGIVEDSLADLRSIFTVTMLVLALWAAVPAVGALMVGVWLRRLVRPVL